MSTLCNLAIMWKVIDVNRTTWVSNVIFSRLIAVSKMLSKSHYDVLGLTPKATQSDVKAAYYKLSMQYHPDKNKGEDAAQTFRDITAAYEVLSNYKLRKLYDRGLLHTVGGEYASHVHPEEKFYKSREKRHQAPTHEGKTPIYDFDEWARAHYGHSFARRAAAKAKFERKERMKASVVADIQSERIISLAMLTFLLITYISYWFSADYDVDQLKNLPQPKINDTQKKES